MNVKLRRIILAALFCAIAVVGANVIKIPGTSIAFDSFPGFLAAMLMGGPYGAVIACIGHIVSAWVSVPPFPLTLPLHLVIAAEMAAICFVTGLLARKGGKMVIVAAVVALVLNGIVSPTVLIFWPGQGLAAYLSILVLLTVASFANVLLATVLYYPLKKPYDMMFGNKK